MKYHVAIILLLASGRGIHDLIVMQMDNKNFVDQEDSVTFWSQFSSKTDSNFHRQSGWKMIFKSNKRLALVYWIRLLLNRSVQRRTQANLSYSMSASRTVIAG